MVVTRVNRSNRSNLCFSMVATLGFKSCKKHILPEIYNRGLHRKHSFEPLRGIKRLVLMNILATKYVTIVCIDTHLLWCLLKAT